MKKNKELIITCFGFLVTFAFVFILLAVLGFWYGTVAMVAVTATSTYVFDKWIDYVF